MYSCTTSPFHIVNQQKVEVFMATYGTRFPQYLSGMMQILWWEMDEAAMIFLMFFAAMVFDHPLIWAGIIVVPWMYIKIKRRGSRGYFKHFLYSLGFVKLKGYPSAFERNFSE